MQIEPTRFEQIVRRVRAMAGQEHFEPAYMYKNPYQDVTFLIELVYAQHESLYDAFIELCALAEGAGWSDKECVLSHCRSAIEKFRTKGLEPDVSSDPMGTK